MNSSESFYVQIFIVSSTRPLAWLLVLILRKVTSRLRYNEYQEIDEWHICPSMGFEVN